MPSIDLVQSTVNREHARELIEAWAEKKHLAPITFIREGLIYYPYYHGQSITSIKRIFPLPPREVKHNWLLDAITGRPFMLSQPLNSSPFGVDETKKILDPVIDKQGFKENILDHLPRFIMRYYKYFYTPNITIENISLYYMEVWLFNFSLSDGKESFLGVNCWSGNIMELEENQFS